MTADISYDLVMQDKMDFAEGSFRLKGGWQVFIFGRHAKDSIETNETAVWKSGVTGVRVTLPKNHSLNKTVVMNFLSKITGVDEWSEVRGPDSMDLR